MYQDAMYEYRLEECQHTSTYRKMGLETGGAGWWSFVRIDAGHHVGSMSTHFHYEYRFLVIIRIISYNLA